MTSQKPRIGLSLWLLTCGITQVGASVACAQESQLSAPHQHHHGNHDESTPGEEPSATTLPSNNGGDSSQPPASENDASSAAQHVPPEPPQLLMPAMSHDDMVAMMQMDDTARTGKVLLDQFEWRHTKAGNAAVWDGEAWYGADYDKLRIRTEGKRVQGTTEDARVELLWDRIISRWWNLQAGAREDFGNGPSRTWAALGLQGLAPYWFDVAATLYVGDAGRTAARVKAEYDLLLTQRLIAQPEAEVNVYGKRDPLRQIDSGVSDLDVGLRIRYEFRREVAPYVGLVWRRLWGPAADATRAKGGSAGEFQLLAGLRVWF